MSDMKIKCCKCEKLFASLPDWKQHDKAVHYSSADFDLVNEDGSKPQRGVSQTIVDMPKVTQMLDAGWHVCIFKNPLTTYTAMARHDETAVMKRTRDGLIRFATDNRHKNAAIGPDESVEEFVDDFHYDDGWLTTDDFTPEQALTRLAYKVVLGEII